MLKPTGGLALVLLLQLSFAGCLQFPDEPVPPSWDVEVSAALARTSHSIREMVGDLASLPPEVLDTLDLTRITIRYEQNIAIGDTSGDGLDDSGLDGEFFRSISHAHIFVEAVNGTPVALELSLSILDEDGAVLLELPAADSLMHLSPAPLDATGKVGAPTSSASDLDVESGLATLFDSAESINYNIDIFFPPNVTVEHVLASDSLSIRTWGTFVSRVDP